MKPAPPQPPPPASDQIQWKAQQQLLSFLKDMGFVESHIRLALEHVDATDENAMEQVLNWLERNPVTEEQKAHSQEPSLRNLVNMGFSR